MQTLNLVENTRVDLNAFKLFEYVTGGKESFIYGQGWIFGLVMAIFAGIPILSKNTKP